MENFIKNNLYFLSSFKNIKPHNKTFPEFKSELCDQKCYPSPCFSSDFLFRWCLMCVCGLVSYPLTFQKFVLFCVYEKFEWMWRSALVNDDRTRWYSKLYQRYSLTETFISIIEESSGLFLVISFCLCLTKVFF